MILFSQNFFRVSPGFCFADGLASLALLRQGMKVNSSKGAYYDWNVTGASLFYLGVEVFLILTHEAFRMLSSFSIANKKILKGACLFAAHIASACLHPHIY